MQIIGTTTDIGFYKLCQIRANTVMVLTINFLQIYQVPFLYEMGQ